MRSAIAVTLLLAGCSSLPEKAYLPADYSPPPPTIDIPLPPPRPKDQVTELTPPEAPEALGVTVFESPEFKSPDLSLSAQKLIDLERHEQPHVRLSFS